jgi:TATA-binding protein-associated factor
VAMNGHLRLVEKLSFDLFSHRWETRHGAAIGLREVLKVHGKGYGKVVGLKKKENEERNQQVFQIKRYFFTF